MVSFEAAVNQTLCKINDNLTQLKFLEQARNVRDNNIYFFTVPENGGTRVFTAGTTKVDFLVGNIINPGGSTERLQHSLQNYKLEFVHSISIDSSQDIIIKINDSPKRTISADFSTQIPWLTFNFIEITCTVDTNIALFACTNPQAVIGQFKQTTVNILEQESINGDGTELATNDAIVNLKNNLNRIRYNIITITGEVWGTVSHSIAAVWAKFHATTGHKHTGAVGDSPNLAGTVITNTPSGTIAATNVQAALNELDTEKETPAAAQTKVDTHAALTASHGQATIEGIAGSQAKVNTHAALTTGVHGVAGATVVGTTTTQDISNKRLNDITIMDTDASPIADRMLRVTDGVPKFRDTGDTTDIPVDNADKLDTKHYSDIATEIDTDIATHAALVSSHGVTTIQGAAEAQAKVDTHAALTSTHGGALQTAAMKNVASGIAGLDANALVPLLQIPYRLPRGLIGTFAWADMTVVQGTWSGGAYEYQTDYDDLIYSAPGYILNDTAANLDEFKVPTLVLNAGTYEITLVIIKESAAGILELLHGAASIGTHDLYNSSTLVNQVIKFTYSPTIRTAADLRFRVNGKNASSTSYRFFFSRIQIKKTTATVDIATHAALSAAGTHGSDAAATASKIMIRDAAGRCAVVAPAEATDIALKSTVTDDIATHAALSAIGTHGSTPVAIASKIMIRDASGRCAVVAPAEATDIALKSTVTDDIATHAALTNTHGGDLQTAAMKNVASGIAGLDAQIRSARSQLPSICRSGFFGCVAVADLITSQGTWSPSTNASQTDYDDLLVSAAGYYDNLAAPANLDLVYLGPLTLNAGTYEIKVVVVTGSTCGILEVLHGATSLGTFDCYSASTVYNVIATFTYSPTTRVSQYLNFRVNGKHASSTDYHMMMSRIQIRKTA